MSDNAEKNWLGQTQEPKVEPKTESAPQQNIPQDSTNTEQNSYTTNGTPMMNAEEFAQFQQITGGWSWGGSFFTMFTIIVGKNWGMLTLYILSWIIPVVNFFAIIGWFIYGGLNGKKIIYNSPALTNISEKQGAIKAMEMAGFAAFILMLIGLIASIVFLSGIALLAAIFTSEKSSYILDFPF